MKPAFDHNEHRSAERRAGKPGWAVHAPQARAHRHGRVHSFPVGQHDVTSRRLLSRTRPGEVATGPGHFPLTFARRLPGCCDRRPARSLPGAGRPHCIREGCIQRAGRRLPCRPAAQFRAFAQIRRIESKPRKHNSDPFQLQRLSRVQGAYDQQPSEPLHEQTLTPR